MRRKMATDVDVSTLLSDSNQILNGFSAHTTPELLQNLALDTGTVSSYSEHVFHHTEEETRVENNRHPSLDRIIDTDIVRHASQAGMSASNIMDYIQSELSTCARDIFVNRLIQKVGSDSNLLDELRTQILDWCKQCESFPYPDSVLKRRNLRKSRLEKLAKDCFVLYRAYIGDVCDELFDVLNNQPRRNTQVNSVSDYITTGALQSLNETIARMERDISTLKGEYTQDVECLHNKVNQLMKSNSQLEIDLAATRVDVTNSKEAMNKLRTNTLKAIEHLRTENKTNQNDNTKCNGIIEHVKVQLCDVQRDLKALKESELSTLEQRSLKTEKLCNRLESRHSDLRSLTNCLKSKVDDGCLDITKISDDRHLGIASMKSKVTLLKQKLASMDDEVKIVDGTCKSTNSAVGELKRKINTIERELKKKSKNISYADAAKRTTTMTSQQQQEPPLLQHPKKAPLPPTSTSTNTPRQQEEDVPVPPDPVPENTTVTSQPPPPMQGSTDVNMTSSLTDGTALRNVPNKELLSVTHRIPVHDNKPMQGSSSTDMELSRAFRNMVMTSPTTDDGSAPRGIHVHGDDELTVSHRIPVHVNTTSQVSKTDHPDEFCSAPPRNRTRRYYIGRINKSCSDQAIKNYMTTRGVTVTHLGLFKKPERRFASAQLNVLADDRIHVENVDFWPPDIIVKPWLSKRKFWQQFEDRQRPNDDEEEFNHES